MSEELKPCPFCGTPRPVIARREQLGGAEFQYVTCTACGARGPERMVVSPLYQQKVIDDWNRRALSARASAGEGGPVGWLITWNDGSQKLSFDRCHEDDGSCVPVYTAAPQPARASAGEGEPIGYVDPQRIHELKEGRLNIALFAERMGGNSLPLYAAAPQPAQAGASGGGGALFGYVSAHHVMDMARDGGVHCKAAEDYAHSVPVYLAPASPATGEEDSPQDISWWVRRLKVQEAITDKYVARVAELESSQPVAAQHWSADSSFYKDDVVSEQDAKESFKGETLSAAPQPQECGANGSEGCSYRQCGPNGESQCQFCGATPPAHGDGEGDAWTYPNRNALIREVCEGLRGYRFDVDPVCVMAIINSIPAQVFSRMAPPALTTRPTPEAQEARDAADARRYRWLRSLPTGPGTSTIGDFHFTLAQHRPAPNRWCVDSVRGDSLDAAIDAALALPAQGEGKNG